MRIPLRNAEGYADPTAQAALQNIVNEEAAAGKLVRNIKRLLAAEGYELVNRIVIRDTKTGRIYR